MPRKNNLSIDTAIAILMEFSDHFNNDELPDYSDPVWQQMSKYCQNAWSAHNWWVNVKYNRREIFSLVKQKMGFDDMSHLVNVSISTEGTDNNESTYSNDFTFDSKCQKDDTCFNLILSSDEWK